MADKLSAFLIKGFLTAGILAVFSGPIFWGFIFLCYLFQPPAPAYEPWDGCADPTSQAELDAWIAHSQATGTSLCDPDVVNMTFDEPPQE
ncbi:MAG: hypothetical protein WBA76_18330 [Phormidesmis sp.]